MCRHIYDWNIVNCDVKQPFQLNSTPCKHVIDETAHDRHRHPGNFHPSVNLFHHTANVCVKVALLASLWLSMFLFVDFWRNSLLCRRNSLLCPALGGLFCLFAVFTCCLFCRHLFSTNDIWQLARNAAPSTAAAEICNLSFDWSITWVFECWAGKRCHPVFHLIVFMPSLLKGPPGNIVIGSSVCLYVHLFFRNSAYI